ncbi:MAG: hypothetical protein JRN62_04135 [Nitrososphaerota archaeon]|jgi:hypothetical protein|nr:hypothetical protein [Nitrososphaerota archaeon]MDG6948792.1 hypothetical protein [Nitrososphaerota archaeon]
MKVSRRRAITQTLDLFILIAAVLGVGALVITALYGLVGAATTNASIQVVTASATGGATSGSNSITALSITVKNSGSSNLPSNTMYIELGGTSGSPTYTSGSILCNDVASGTAAVYGTSVAIECSSVALAQGAQESIVLLNPITMTVGWNEGTSYQVTVVYGNTQTSVTVTA